MNSVVTAYPDALPLATGTSLSLPESLTFEQWEEIGAELANRARKLNWWIGDWWAAGHHRYGERARLAARGLFGKEFKTLANIASVCRAFEPSRRREHLSWSHHAEAAALSPNAADMLLDLAERDRMSKAQVRAAVITIRGGPPSRAATDEAAIAGLFRAYNRLPCEVRILVAQAFAAVAASGAEIDPATGNPKTETLPDTAFDLVPDMEAAEVEVEPDAMFDLAPEMEAPQTEIDPYISFDLTLDMAALQAEGLAQAEADLPLDLASEMELVPADAEPRVAFEFEPAMEETQSGTAPKPALDLGPEMEEDKKKTPSGAIEPWLLP